MTPASTPRTSIQLDTFEPNDQLLQPATVGNLEGWALAWPFEALSIHNPSDRDLYLFSIETLVTYTYRVNLTIENRALDLDLYLYHIDNETGAELIRSSVSGVEGQAESLDFTGLGPGEYILEVLPYISGTDQSVLSSRYELSPHKAEPNTPIGPIQISLKPVGAVINGTLQANTTVMENRTPPSPVESRTDGLLDLSTVNRLSFTLQPNLIPEQVEWLQNQAPAEPIRFRIALHAAAGEQEAVLNEADLIFSVIATDPISLSPTAELVEPIRINLAPDSAGFYEWPVFDQQARGQGFVVADLLIDAIPVNDNLQEGTETGSFSIVDLSGAVFGSPSSSDGLAPNNSGELRVVDAVMPNTPIEPIQISLKPVGAVINGTLQANTIVMENRTPPSPVESRTDGLLDLSTVNRLSFTLQPNLIPEQAEWLQNQAPTEPIRFRIALNAAAGEQGAVLNEADLIFSVIATDPISLSPTAEVEEPIRINLTPDSAGFYEWPVFDQQARGQGFVVADLLIDAIPVNDNLQEGIETGSFSIIDLSGAIFGSPSSSDGLAPNNSGELKIADAVGSPATPLLFNLDVDGDGRVTPLGDGLMIIRKLFGSAFPNEALTAKAISPEATRDTSAIHSYIQRGIDQGLLDVDRDGQTKPLSDGLMVIRQLFGDAFRGEALINKAISDTSSLIPQGQALSDLTPAGRLDLANLVRQEITALLPPSSSP